MKDMLYDFDT